MVNRSRISAIIFACSCLVIGLLGIQGLFPPRVRSQTSQDAWTDPALIHKSRGFCTGLSLMQWDENIQLFWVENPTSDQQADLSGAVFHMQRDGERWLEPNDILVAPSGNAIDGFSLVQDDEGRLYLLLLDRGNRYPYLTSVGSADVGQPRSWDSLRRVVFEGVLRASLHYNESSLYIAYIPVRGPSELYVIKSSDGGVSWSYPVRISSAAARGEVPTGGSWGIGPDGVFHFVWSQAILPDGYPPQRMLYSCSVDDGESWSEPLELVEGQYASPALLVTSDNVLYLAYNGAASIGGRYFQWSLDGGQTWSNRKTIATGVGGLTGGVIRLDSAGVLHFVSASHIGINGVAYSQWDGFEWTSLVDVAKTSPDAGGNTRQAYEPRLLITEGNRLHAMYLGEDHASIFYTTAQSSAPAVPVPTSVSLTAVTKTPLEREKPTVTADADQTVTLSPTSQIDLPEEGRLSVINPVLIGALPAVVVVVVILVLRSWRMRR